MSLLEAIVALAIGLGVVAGALEASRLATERAAMAALDTEAALWAENLLFTAGLEWPLEPGHREGRERDREWSIDMALYLSSPRGPQAFDVVVQVTIQHGGLSARADLATLKVVPESAP